MIVLGIIAIVIGGVLYFNGNTINNDLDAQMESVFNDGISNPGSNYETIGIFLLVVGIALLIIGTIVSVGKKDTNQVSEKPESEASSQSNKATCSQCGAAVLEDSKFCIACGAKIEQIKSMVTCPPCNHAIPSGSNFCLYCGKAISEHSNSLDVTTAACDKSKGDTI